MANRRNVLFIIIDQLRADCLFGELAAHVKLPHLRALMNDGVTFRNHWSVCNPCGPSRASILTGQYAMNHRAVRNGTPLPADRPNLATEMRGQGYLPLLYGYTDTAQDPRQFDPADPVLRSYEEVLPGFLEAIEMRLETSWPWRAHLAAKGYDVPPYPDIFRPDGPSIDDPALYRAEDSDTAFLTDATLRDLAARPAGWFAHLTYIRPHPPFVAPAPYNRMYAPQDLPRRVPGQGGHPFMDAIPESAAFPATVEGFPDLQPTDENIARIRAIYLGLASEVDHHLGRVIAWLKQRGIYDDTLVVVTADHGEMLGDHGLWGKMTFHDAAYHTPLIIRDPDHAGAAGRVVDAPTESVDVTPTILDLLAAPIPHSMDGRSLQPLLAGDPPSDWRDHTFSELDFGNPVAPTRWQEVLGLDADQANLAVLRTRDHALIQFAAGLDPMLFARQGSDAGRDLSKDPNAAPILLDLTQRMLCHRMQNPEGTFARTMITGQGVRTG